MVGRSRSVVRNRTDREISDGMELESAVGPVGETQDPAHTHMYLMREAYSTGQVIVVDGGAVLA